MMERFSVAYTVVRVQAFCRSLFKVFSLFFVVALVGCRVELTDIEHLQRAKDFQDKSDAVSAIIELKNAARKNPDNPEVRWLLGKLYLETGNAVASEKELYKARDLGVEYSDIVVYLGRSWFIQGKYQMILDELKVLAADSDARKKEILVLRADAFRNLRQFNLAKKQYQAALAVDRNYLAAYVGLSRLYLGQNNIERAKAYFEQAEEIKAVDPSVLLMKGELFYALGEYTVAEEAYLNLLDLKKDDLLARLGLSQSQLANKKIEAGAKNLDKILAVTPNHTYSNYLRGLAAFELQNYEQSKEFTANVLSVFPGHFPSVLISGAANFAIGEYEQAISKLDKIVAAVPEHEYARRLLAATHQKLGNELLAFEILKPLASNDYNDATLLSNISALAIRSGNIQEANKYLMRAVALQPDNANIRAQLGMTQLSLGEVEKGLSELSAAAEMSPGSGMPEVAFIQGLLLAQEYSQALEEAVNLQEKMPGDSIGFVLAGIAYQKMDNNSEAEKNFLEALQIDSAAEDAAFNLATMYSKSYRDLEAKSILERALQEKPDSQLLLTAIARLETKLGNGAAAQEYLERLVDKYPANNLAVLLLSRLYLLTGQPDKAIDELGSIEEDFQRELAVLEVMGRAQLDAGKASEAVTTFFLLTSDAPESPAAHYWLGKALVKTGDVAAAENAFQKALSIAPEYFSAGVELLDIQLAKGKIGEAEKLFFRFRNQAPDNLSLLFRGAKVALAKGDVDKAIPLFVRVHENQGSAKSAVSLANAYFMKGDQDKGEMTLKTWLDTSPDSASVIFFLGAYYQMQGRYREAVNLFNRLVEMDANNWVYHNELAAASFFIDDITVAEKHAQVAYGLSPDNPVVKDTYGQLLMARGENKKAQDMFEMASKLMPSNPEIELHLAQSLIRNGSSQRALDILNRLRTSNIPEKLLEKVKDTISRADSQ